ncbi:MAG: hypothetical protein WDM80_10225 [Limisphaerales bacterium]
MKKFTTKPDMVDSEKDEMKIHEFTVLPACLLKAGSPDHIVETMFDIFPFFSGTWVLTQGINKTG